MADNDVKKELVVQVNCTSAIHRQLKWQLPSDPPGCVWSTRFTFGTLDSKTIIDTGVSGQTRTLQVVAYEEDVSFGVEAKCDHGDVQRTIGNTS